MMLEIGGTEIFGFLVTLLSMFGGIWLKRLDNDLERNNKRFDLVQRQLYELRAQIAREASDYLRRDEMDERIKRIEAKIDRLADKLDNKQDRT